MIHELNSLLMLKPNMLNIIHIHVHAWMHAYKSFKKHSTHHTGIKASYVIILIDVEEEGATYVFFFE